MFVKYKYKLPKLTERAVINREWIKILFAWILEKKKKVNTVLVGWVKLLQIFVLWKLNKSYCYTFHIMFCVMYKRKLRINTHTKRNVQWPSSRYYHLKIQKATWKVEEKIPKCNSQNSWEAKLLYLLVSPASQLP